MLLEICEFCPLLTSWLTPEPATGWYGWSWPFFSAFAKITYSQLCLTCKINSNSLLKARVLVAFGSIVLYQTASLTTLAPRSNCIV